MVDWWMTDGWLMVDWWLIDVLVADFYITAWHLYLQRAWVFETTNSSQVADSWRPVTQLTLNAWKKRACAIPSLVQWWDFNVFGLSFFWKRPTPDFQSGAQYLPASVGWVGDLWETSWMGSLVLTKLLVKLGDVRMITYIRIYILYVYIYIM